MLFLNCLAIKSRNTASFSWSQPRAPLLLAIKRGFSKCVLRLPFFPSTCARTRRKEKCKHIPFGNKRARCGTCGHAGGQGAPRDQPWGSLPTRLAASQGELPSDQLSQQDIAQELLLSFALLLQEPCSTQSTPRAAPVPGEDFKPSWG